MKIIQKAIHIIDYENSSVISRDIPAEFESYVTDLINHISDNDSVREYKTRSNSTEVISCVISICNNLYVIIFLMMTLYYPKWKP